MFRKTIWYFLPLLLWLLLVFNFSSQPFSQQDLVPKMQRIISEESLQQCLPKVEFYYGNSLVSYKEPYGFVQFFIRKGAHLFVYAVLGLLTMRSLVLLGRSLGYRRVLVISAVLALFFAIGIASLDELMQFFNQDRTGMLQDVFLDTIGAICGIIMYCVFIRRPLEE